MEIELFLDLSFEIGLEYGRLVEVCLARLWIVALNSFLLKK
jgi:hypothetical protein